jgi:hypothetical protein
MSEPTIVVNDEGEQNEYSLDEYVNETRRWAGTSVMAQTEAALQRGDLPEKVRHNDHVVERAMEEDDVHYARLRVPYWFVQKDDEARELMGRDDQKDVLIEDYSEKAWRVIASETDSMAGDQWFNYEWVFLPKSVVTVTHMEMEDHSRDAVDEIVSDIHSSEEEFEDEWDDMDWEEKADAVEA